LPGSIPEDLAVYGLQFLLLSFNVFGLMLCTCKPGCMHQPSEVAREKQWF
jgi:hypothetical protein